MTRKSQKPIVDIKQPSFFKRSVEKLAAWRSRTTLEAHRQIEARVEWYRVWHLRRHHKKVHWFVAATYTIGLMFFFLTSVGIVKAADFTDNWNFAALSNFLIDNGLEQSGTAVRLKAQNYETDGNTRALYHFDESSGINAADSSVNNNTLTTSGLPNFVSGNLNNALSLNGTNQFASASDSSSLSITGQQSIESWIKPSGVFNNNSSNNQMIADKGSYKLGLDGTSGKAFYEIENNNSQQWTKRMGDGQAGSWDFNHGTVEAMVNYGSDVIVGIGNARGDGEVWRWNGSSWSKIGGDGLNSSWPDQTYEVVASLAINGNTLFAGLGNGTGDGEVWSCNIATSCTAWSKIGGDGTGITVGTASVQSMAVYGGNLFVGTFGNAGFGDVYRYNGGTSWSQIGGDGLNAGWAASTYESVSSLTSDGTFLYAGLGTTTTDGEVWRYNGSSWSQIGGDGVNSSWNTNYETVESLYAMGGFLYAGLGNGSSDGELWRYNGTSWSQIGGDGVNSSWNNTNFTSVLAITGDGTNIYVGLGSVASSAFVYRWNGSTWTLLAGGGNTWTTSYTKSLLFANSILYAGNSNISGAPANPGSSVWQYQASSWSNIGGHYLNNSWGSYNITSVSSSATHNGKMYVGVIGSASNALLYEYDGTSATLIGGNSVRSSWSMWNYNGVTALASYKGELYAGLSSSNSANGEIWKYNGTTWTQIGGDGLNSSWTVNSTVADLTIWNNTLYMVMQGTVGYSQVWGWNGSSWTRVDSGWSNFIYEGLSLTVFNNQLCLGGGGNGSGSAVYCWSGSGAWTLVGGRGVNGSWSLITNGFVDLTVHNGFMYAAENNANGDLTVWRWSGTGNWQQIGGGGLNNSWSILSYASQTTIPMVAYNGDLYMGTSGSATAGDVWKWDGITWSKVAGGGLNNSWTIGQNIEQVRTLNVYKGKLYAGLGNSSNADALVYSYGNNGYIESSTSSFANTWQHLAATYDGVNMKLYINGNLDASAAVSATGSDNSYPLLIGKSYGSQQSGATEEHFKGQIDELRISNIARSSFTTLPYSSSEQAITPVSAIRTSGVRSWDGFSVGATLNGGTISFRLSDDDGATWKYWNGSAWVTSSGLTQANSAALVNANIEAFPVTFKGIKWQAFLKGNGSQQVTLNNVAITSNADNSAPSPNADNIKSYTNNGGTEIAEAAWTNDTSPYFTWMAANDSGAGLYGYCLYLGQTETSDPITSKGVLGTSPVETGNKCPYVVSTTSLDTATAGVLASNLNASNTPYYLKIKALDKAGNITASSAQISFRVDNAAPSNPSYATAPAQFSANKEATLTWPTDGVDGAFDAQSGIAGLQYKIGIGGSWRGDGIDGSGLLINDGSYTTRSEIDFADIMEGNNVFYFRAVDNAGNVSPGFVAATLRINTGAPSSPQNLTVTPAVNTSNSFAFSWSEPVTFAGEANALTYCYTINTLPTANTCTFTAGGVTSLAEGAYATQPGENTFYVVAKDNNINYATAASVTFTANTSAPGIPLDIEIADISNRATETWKLAMSWNPPTNVGAGVANYRVFRSIDNVSFSQVASTAGTSYVDSGLSQMKYYYQVRACDSANNCGAMSGGVEQTPTGRFTSPANLTAKPVVSNVTTKRAAIAWSTDRGSDSRIAIGKKPGQYAPAEFAQSGQVTDHRIELNNLEAGVRYFYVTKWTDVDGNIGVSDEGTFETAPAPVVKQVSTSKVGLNSAIVNFTSFGAVQARVNFGRTDSFGGVKSINTSTSESVYNVELEGLDDGIQYFYQVTLLDNEGGEYKGDIYSFTTPQRPRISDLRFEPVKGEPTSTQRITWITNVDTTASVTYGREGTVGTDILDSAFKKEHEIIIRGLSDDSVYFLVAQSRDANGNLAVSDRQTFKTALDTRPPKISDVSIETVVKGTGSEASGQIVVSWTTDEPSTSQVAFGEGSIGSGVTSLSTEDANLTTEHVVIISDLSPARVYNVQAISRDSARNEAKADAESAIIGRATESILSIIVNVLQQVFGFEVK